MVAVTVLVAVVAVNVGWCVWRCTDVVRVRVSHSTRCSAGEWLWVWGVGVGAVCGIGRAISACQCVRRSDQMYERMSVSPSVGVCVSVSARCAGTPCMCWYHMCMCKMYVCMYVRMYVCVWCMCVRVCLCV